MTDAQKSIEHLYQRCGYISCQIEVAEHLLSTERRLCEKAKVLRLELDQALTPEKRTEIQEKIKLLKAEAQAVRGLWHHVSSMQPCSELLPIASGHS